MPVTQEQTHKVAEWARSHRVDLSCRTCADRPLMTIGEIVESPVYNPEEFDTANTVLWLELVCSNCGAVKLFRASVIGLP